MEFPIRETLLIQKKPGTQLLRKQTLQANEALTSMQRSQARNIRLVMGMWINDVRRNQMARYVK
jgi:hypothetical protein